VFTVLLFVAAVFPDNGISLTKSMRLKFIQPKEIFSAPEKYYADISGIIANNELLDDSMVIELSAIELDRGRDTIKANADSLRSVISRIQFPEKGAAILYPAFRAFDKAAKSSKPVRIMHYGDSQIEGDRMTSFLRNRLQKKFGGMGPGLVPLKQVYDFSFSTIHKTSDNWFRFTLYGKRDTTLTHNRYGALASFSRFTSNMTDTMKTKPLQEVWVSFSPSAFGYSNTRTFSMCRVFYGYNKDPFVAELYQNEELIDADMYPASNSLQIIRWKFDQPVNKIKIVFKGTSSPDFYGIALDGQSGIAVDNIPMRGNAGLIFTRMNRELLQKHFRELNIRMILLQFGGNIVPHVVSDYGYYKEGFKAQLHEIKKIAPDVPVIVIGVADMSVQEGDHYVSYPNIEKVRDALKTASLESGVAYWDLYEAMGGKNSMPSWVFADPPLASSDFVHFNPEGAKIIANMFYNALMFEYNRYMKTGQ